uniref:Rad21/Rec8-like protein C-terminal eukaryotic domain-containing protein n=1 Tax=Hippocampus comes TaxID=109280 RepID=A0A3Q2YT00_HIPCM
MKQMVPVNLSKTSLEIELADLCSGNTRMQVARTFHCFLVLQKEGAVSLHQSEPYQDIFVTPGPAFFLLENAKTDDV